MTIHMCIASIAWILLVSGYLLRRHRQSHVRLVSSAIALDVALVLFLQVTRGAVQTALSFKLAVLQQIHIGFSTCALLLYIPVVVWGLKLLNNKATPQERVLHKRVATAALILRTLGFAFMFSMWKTG